MPARQSRFDLGPNDRPTQPTPPTPSARPRVSQASIYVQVPTPTISSSTTPQEFPCLFFDPTLYIPLADRASILSAIKQLPPESIVSQFSRGNCPWGPVAGASTTEATVYKGWHQPENEHFTIDLRWVDSQRNHIAGGAYGGAHVHENGLESIKEHATGTILVRKPGSIVYDIYPPGWKIASRRAEKTEWGPGSSGRGGGDGAG